VVRGQVDAELAHHLDRVRVDRRGLAARALHGDAVAEEHAGEPSAIWLRAELATQRKRMLRGGMRGEFRGHGGSPFGRAGGEVALLRPERDVHEADEHRHLDEGPMTAANAAPLWMPKLAMATAMASSKLLEAAVNESVAVCGSSRRRACS
jgi:hypothetical protein